MRNVTIVSTQASTKVEISTSATTFGQLQEEVGSRINFSGTKTMIRETKTSLESVDSVLPSGDFVLFVLPQKTKAGFDPAMFSNSASGILQAIGAAYNEQSVLIKRLEDRLVNMERLLQSSQESFLPTTLKADSFFDDNDEEEDELLAEAQDFANGIY